ncbi:hypothetical protein ACFL59_00740 [Planctomycetota bacterium]
MVEQVGRSGQVQPDAAAMQAQKGSSSKKFADVARAGRGPGAAKARGRKLLKKEVRRKEQSDAERGDANLRRDGFASQLQQSLLADSDAATEPSLERLFGEPGELTQDEAAAQAATGDAAGELTGARSAEASFGDKLEGAADREAVSVAADTDGASETESQAPEAMKSGAPDGKEASAQEAMQASAPEAMDSVARDGMDAGAQEAVLGSAPEAMRGGDSRDTSVGGAGGESRASAAQTRPSSAQAGEATRAGAAKAGSEAAATEATKQELAAEQSQDKARVVLGAKGQDKAEADEGGLESELENNLFATEIGNPLMAQRATEPQPVAEARPVPQIPQAVVDRVVERARFGMTVEGGHEFQVDLKEDILGGAELKIQTKDGRLTVQVISDDPSVQQSIDQLAEHLSERGLEVDHVQVMTSDQARAEADARQRDRQRDRQQDKGGQVPGPEQVGGAGASRAGWSEDDVDLG